MKFILEPYRHKEGRLELRCALYSDDGRVLVLREIAENQQTPDMNRLFELTPEVLMAFCEEKRTLPGYTWADGVTEKALEAARPPPNIILS